MSLPERFESYKGYVIRPFSIDLNGRWAVGAFIRSESSDNAERSFQEKGKFAASYDEALELGIAFGKFIVDTGAMSNP